MVGWLLVTYFSGVNNVKLVVITTQKSHFRSRAVPVKPLYWFYRILDRIKVSREGK